MAFWTRKKLKLLVINQSRSYNKMKEDKFNCELNHNYGAIYFQTHIEGI